MYLASDHRGLALKDALAPFLTQHGFTVKDLTPAPETDGMIDYSRVGQMVAKAITSNQDSLGLLICGSGVGVCIAANRFKGVRAMDARSSEDVAVAKEHDFINVVCLGADNLTPAQAETIIQTWLTTKEDHAERRVRRAHQLDEYGS